MMSFENNFHLSAKELKSFQQNGFIGPFKLYDEEEAKQSLREVRAELFNREYAPYDASLEAAIANYDRHLDIPFLSQHICRPEIVDRLQSIIGDDILCWRSEFIPKKPGAEGTDWHQADTFAHASGEPQIVWPDRDDQDGCINVWTAFTEASLHTGCLLFIPNTHDQSYYDESKGLKFDPTKNNNVLKGGVRRGFNGYDYRELQMDPSWSADESKAIPMVMRPGEFVIFKSRLLHASKPNSSEVLTRMGYVARYVPGNVKVYPDTNHVEEFGASFSLDRYGVVEVLGKNLEPANTVKHVNNRGIPFNHYASVSYAE